MRCSTRKAAAADRGANGDTAQRWTIRTVNFTYLYFYYFSFFPYYILHASGKGVTFSKPIFQGCEGLDPQQRDNVETAKPALLYSKRRSSTFELSL